jgi:hypothetical protein
MVYFCNFLKCQKPLKGKITQSGHSAFTATLHLQGNLVLLPFKFLENEDLLPSYFAKEGIVPSVTWT